MAGGSVSRKILLHIALGLFLMSTVLMTVSIELQFNRYHFRKKSNWGRAVNRAEHTCREDVCQSIEDMLQKDICIRKCISPSCYEELYSWNELEQGERDIRWTSFKGCAADELRKKEYGNKYDL